MSKGGLSKAKEPINDYQNTLDECKKLNADSSIDQISPIHSSVQAVQSPIIPSLSKLNAGDVTSFVTITEETINLTFSFPKSKFGEMSLAILEQLKITNIQNTENFQESGPNKTPTNLVKSGSKCYPDSHSLNEFHTSKETSNKSFFGEITDRSDMDNCEEILSSYMEEQNAAKDEDSLETRNSLEYYSETKDTTLAIKISECENCKKDELGNLTAEVNKIAENVTEHADRESTAEDTNNLQISEDVKTHLYESQSDEKSTLDHLSINDESADKSVSLKIQEFESFLQSTPERQRFLNLDENPSQNELEFSRETTKCVGNSMEKDESNMRQEINNELSSQISKTSFHQSEVSKMPNRGFVSLENDSSNSDLTKDTEITKNGLNMIAVSVVSETEIGSEDIKISANFIKNSLKNELEFPVEGATDEETESAKSANFSTPITATNLQLESSEIMNKSRSNSENPSILQRVNRNNAWPKTDSFTKLKSIPTEEIKSCISTDMVTKFFKIQLGEKCLVIKAMSTNSNEISIEAAEYKNSLPQQKISANPVEKLNYSEVPKDHIPENYNISNNIQDNLQLIDNLKATIKVTAENIEPAQSIEMCEKNLTQIISDCKSNEAGSDNISIHYQKELKRSINSTENLLVRSENEAYHKENISSRNETGNEFISKTYSVNGLETTSRERKTSQASKNLNSFVNNINSHSDEKTLDVSAVDTEETTLKSDDINEFVKVTFERKSNVKIPSIICTNGEIKNSNGNSLIKSRKENSKTRNNQQSLAKSGSSKTVEFPSTQEQTTFNISRSKSYPVIPDLIQSTLSSESSAFNVPPNKLFNVATPDSMKKLSSVKYDFVTDQTKIESCSQGKGKRLSISQPSSPMAGSESQSVSTFSTTNGNLSPVEPFLKSEKAESLTKFLLEVSKNTSTVKHSNTENPQSSVIRSNTEDSSNNHDRKPYSSTFKDTDKEPLNNARAADLPCHAVGEITESSISKTGYSIASVATDDGEVDSSEASMSTNVDSSVAFMSEKFSQMSSLPTCGSSENNGIPLSTDSAFSGVIEIGSLVTSDATEVDTYPDSIFTNPRATVFPASSMSAKVGGIDSIETCMSSEVSMINSPVASISTKGAETGASLGTQPSEVRDDVVSSSSVSSEVNEVKDSASSMVNEANVTSSIRSDVDSVKISTAFISTEICNTKTLVASLLTKVCETDIASLSEVTETKATNSIREVTNSEDKVSILPLKVEADTHSATSDLKSEDKAPAASASKHEIKVKDLVSNHGSKNGEPVSIHESKDWDPASSASNQETEDESTGLSRSWVPKNKRKDEILASEHNSENEASVLEHGSEAPTTSPSKHESEDEAPAASTSKHESEDEAPAASTSKHESEDEAPAASTSKHESEDEAPTTSTSKHESEDEAPAASPSKHESEDEAPAASPSKHESEDEARAASPSKHESEDEAPDASTSKHESEDEAPAASTSKHESEDEAPAASTSKYESEDEALASAYEGVSLDSTCDNEYGDSSASAPTLSEEEAPNVSFSKHESKNNAPTASASKNEWKDGDLVSAHDGQCQDLISVCKRNSEISKDKVSVIDSSTLESADGAPAPVFRHDSKGETFTALTLSDVCGNGASVVSEYTDNTSFSQMSTTVESHIDDNLKTVDTTPLKNEECGHEILEYDSQNSLSTEKSATSLITNLESSIEKSSATTRKGKGSFKTIKSSDNVEKEKPLSRIKRVEKSLNITTDEVDLAPVRPRNKIYSPKLSEVIPEDSIVAKCKISKRYGSAEKTSPVKRSLRSKSLEPSPTKISSKSNSDRKSGSFSVKRRSSVGADETATVAKLKDMPLKKDLMVAVRSSPRKAAKAAAGLSSVEHEVRNTPQKRKSNTTNSESESSKSRTSSKTAKEASSTVRRSKRGAKE